MRMPPKSEQVIRIGGHGTPHASRIRCTATPRSSPPLRSHSWNPAPELPRRTTADPTAAASPRRAGTPLTAEQERDYARRIADGDREARNQMVRANLGLVTVIARDYAGNGLDIEDLVGEGQVGLIAAAERFDPRFNTRFSTYAGWWIRQAIREALGNTAAMIRLPMHAVHLLARWRRTAVRLGRALGREPRFDEVAGAMGLPAGKRQIIEQALRTRHRADTVAGPWGPAVAPVDDEDRSERRRTSGGGWGGSTRSNVGHRAAVRAGRRGADDAEGGRRPAGIHAGMDAASSRSGPWRS